MTSYDLTKTAEDFRREAKRDDYRARKDAERAESYYRTARRTREHLAWLTHRPDMWDEDGCDLALVARNVRSWEHIADTFLRSSFRATERAHHHRKLARDYFAMAARRTADFAEIV
jgi:hypothetical protein